MKDPRLFVALWLRRHGVLPIAAFFLAMLGLGLHFFGTRQLQDETANHRIAIATQQAEAATPAADIEPPLQEQRHAAFRAALAEGKSMPDIVRILFREAHRNHLALSQMEYKLAESAEGEYRIYRLAAPVKGSYGDVRRFAEGVLASVPAAALEDIGFKRESAGSPNIEAKLRFAIYLKGKD